VTPSGRVLPCHAAETLTGLHFPSVRDASLADIWYSDPAFARAGRHGWQNPVAPATGGKSTGAVAVCQAFALTGDAGATDPACSLSPDHAVMASAIARPQSDELIYRRLGGGTQPASA